MNRLALVLATFFGTGFFPKGPGTLASLVVCIVYFFSWPAQPSLLLQAVFLLILGAVFFAGVWSATRAEQRYGPDAGCIVIDEVAGQMLALTALPPSGIWIMTSFVLFRLFDITKWLGVGKAEHLPGGWGVMMDDMIAGLWSLVIIQLLMRFSAIS